ncbi:MAG: tetratricopeptide repeat protein [Chloroflexi bacterium]|nr:tetratricopeptide repeat protein [Chloroflexota bacterium]
MTTTNQKYPNCLRQVIKHSGFTVEGIAAETNIPVRTLFDYCAGRTPVPKDRLEVLANALGYPTNYLVPTFSDIYPVQYESTEDSIWILPGVTNKVDQLRRKILQLLLSAGSRVFFPSHKDLINTDAWERLSFALHDPYHTDQATLTHLEAVTTTFWELYRSALAKVDLLSGVAGHLFTVTQLLRSSQTLAVQQRLCSIASNTAQILGEIYFDMNDSQTAEAYYTLAIETAQEIDHAALKAIALGRKGFLSVYRSEYEKALPLLQEAFSLAETTTTGKTKSWIAMMEAEALANLKRKDACLSALEKTERVFDQDQSSTGEDTHWTGFTLSTMAGYKGICYVRLALPTEARPMLQSGLEALPLGPTRRKSLLLSDLATTYLQQREVEEACKIATQALLSAAQTKSARAVTRLLAFQKELREWKDVLCVKQFNEHLQFLRLHDAS